MIKLVVFDWNGVLLADVAACMAADNVILRKFGGKPINLKEYRETIIIPSIQFYKMHGASEKKLENGAEWAKVFHEFYERRAAKCRTRKNAGKLLRWLKQRRVKTIVLSNHTAEGIEAQLERLELRALVAEILANERKQGSLLSRNKKKKLAKYLRENNYAENEVVIIGDSPEEVEIGRELGLKTIALTGGYYSTARLRESKPDFLINNLEEIKKIMKSVD